MLVQLAVADAACIVLLPLAVDPSRAAARAVGAAVLLAGAYVVYLFLEWAELRTSLTILFSLAALAQLMGVSVMLAGFAAGLAVAAMGEPRRLAKQLFALTDGFFGPVFFVWLGASIDLHAVLVRPSLLVLGVVLHSQH